MGKGGGLPARALRVVAVLALVAAAGTACSSGLSSKPVHISLAEATKNPCQLVTVGQATAIHGSGGGNVTAADPGVVGGVDSSCEYGSLSPIVTLTLDFGPIAEYLSVDDLNNNSAPIIFAGHAGVCGPDAGKYGTKGDFQLSAPIVKTPAESAVWLSVDGAPSCAVDAKFAQAVYANL